MIDNRQDLLDELRRENLLKYSTVFLRVAAQARYHHVLKAAEASMDGILVRPYTAGLGNALQSALAELRELSNQVTATAEQAMELSLRGKSAAAVQLLLQAGEQSLNGKLLEMTGALVRRHAAALVDGAELSARAAELMNRCCLPVSHIAGIQRTGRSPGGLQLRLRSAATS